MENQSSNYGLSIFEFIICSLIFGTILREISKRKTFPYTPILLLTGVMFGYFKGNLSTLGESRNLFENLNPEMMLLIFIPALVFDSAYSEVDFGWIEALALGCVLSPIDPVATVNLLNNIGAKERFNTLLQGEALINNSTSMAFFYYFVSLAKKDEVFHESIFTLTSKFIGGPILGIIFGMIICFSIKRIIRDNILSITVSVVGVYSCFYFCEYSKLNFSGILGVIALGLYVCGTSKRKFSQETVKTLNTFWSFLQENCEILIFIIIGFVGGVLIVEGSTITLFDWIRLFLFWFLMIAIRAIVILTFYPILKRNGSGISKKEVIILIYGGTRGAICLVMALIISIDSGLSERYKQIILFYACGMTILTKIVNGLTCQKLINNIDKMKTPEIKKKFFEKCIKEVLGEANQKLSELKNEPNVAYAEWKDVENLASLKVLGSTSSEFVERSLNEDIFSGNAQIIEEIRFRLTRYLHKVYWKMHENGEISESSLGILSENCDIVNDNTSNKLNYFNLLSSSFAMGPMKYYLRLKDTPFIGPLFINLLINKVYDAYETSDAFVEACEEAIQVFENSFPQTEQLNYVVGELKDNMEQGMAYIYELEDNYPTVTRAVHTLKASTTLLKQKKTKLEEMFAQGFIDNKDYDELQTEIYSQISKVQTHNFSLSNIKFNEVLTTCPLFSSLPIHEIVNIRMKSIEHIFTKGTILQSKNQINKYVYFIITGSVREKFDNFIMMKSIGSVVDPYDFIYQEQSKANIKTVNETKIMKIEAKFILELIQKYPEFKKRWYKTIFSYSLKLSAIPNHNNFIELLKPKEKRRFIEKSTVTFLSSQQEYNFPFGCCILQGDVKFELTTLVRGDIIFKPMILRTETEAIVLEFPKVDWKEIEEERSSTVHDLFEA